MSASLSRPRKRFGQHWLRSEKVLKKILAAAAIQTDDRILEIGPGTGILTKSLISAAAAVVAVEIDRELCLKLSDRFREAKNFFLLSGDILELDVPAALSQHPAYAGAPPNRVVANIPYYITGPILEKLLGTITTPNPIPYDSIVLLVQKEVADRLYARPGSRAFGALSVRVGYLANCELICPVPAKAFHPPPKVDSAVVRLTPCPTLPAAKNPSLLEELVKQGFASKRKMLRNNLKSSVERNWLVDMMVAQNIPIQARAEDLSVAQWVALSNKIFEEMNRLEGEG